MKILVWMANYRQAAKNHWPSLLSNDLSKLAHTCCDIWYTAVWHLVANLGIKLNIFFLPLEFWLNITIWKIHKVILMRNCRLVMQKKIHIEAVMEKKIQEKLQLITSCTNLSLIPRFVYSGCHLRINKISFMMQIWTLPNVRIDIKGAVTT